MLDWPRVLVVLFALLFGLFKDQTLKHFLETMSNDIAVPDPNSYANSHEVVVTKFHLDLAADFKAQVLHGHVDLTFKSLKDNVQHAYLDTRDLNISKISCEGKQLEFKLDEKHAAFGSRLTVGLPAAGHHSGAEYVIRVEYATTPQSSAIQWLPPSQTAGKVHPYLFTQCQAIHARAMIPIQDTPGVKAPYTASITAPSPLVALMSALSDGHTAHADTQTATYRFKQPVPMPSYLVALAIGAVEKREIGPRSAVWSEKEMVDAGAFEFADTEKFLKAAEDICGPYVWGRYDILLLPPSFPYGGMENPCLTFVTPTLLAGDRSLANVVAHEIAHSWMGNLVSPKSWEHFWMNEGFTVFLERKIIRRVFGPQNQHLHAVIGWSDLRESVEHFGSGHQYTQLIPDLKGVDPDDAFSSIPYEKGFNFLFYLQSLVGGEEVMDKFLHAHCDKFKYLSTDSHEWKEFFLSYFKDKVPAETLNGIDWQTWYSGPGMPPVENKFDTTLSDSATKLAHDLIQSHAQPQPGDLKGWSSNQVVVFLEKLQDLQQEYYTAHASDQAAALAFTANLLTNMNNAYKFSESKNAEIVFRWCTLGIRSEMESVLPATVQLLKEQGRMKFIRPLYRSLFKSTCGKQVALDTFNAHRTNYHNIAQKMVAKDLGLE